MAETESKRSTGTVKWFSAQKGFGFIAPDDGGEDLFVHQTSIRSDGFRTLSDAQPVEFSVDVGEDGRTKAVDVVSIFRSRRAPRGGRSGGTGRGFYGGRGRGSGGGYNNDGGYGRGGGYTGGSGSGGGACYNCGRYGHLARDCYQGGGGGAGGGSRRYGDGGAGGGSRRYGDGGAGGGSRRYGGGGGGSGSGAGGYTGGGGRGCYNCGEEGHFARDCPNVDDQN